MQPIDSHPPRRLRRELLSYWMEHPEAKDTADGIRLWWLKERSGLPIAVLQEELEELARLGWVVGRGGGEAGRIFALNHDQMESISAYLREDTSESEAIEGQPD